MIKKLSIFLVAILLAVPVMAQPGGRFESAQFAPRERQFQVSLILGRGLFFPIENSSYLLPNVGSGSSLGLPDGTTPNQSGDPAVKFHIGSLNKNSIANMAGIQGKYFITNRWEVNAMFSMDIGVQPQQPYTEGLSYESAYTSSISPVEYVQGRLTNDWLITAGSNYYFNNCNGRIFPYLGVLAGYQHARIQATLPYTGEYREGGEWDDMALYYANSRAGEVFGITGAFTAGIEYNLLPGLNIAFEVRPFSYMYTVGRMYSEGIEWHANVHTFKFFALPQFKIGIRF